MVRHDVAGTVRQEQIVQYIQHINPVHTTNGGRGWEADLPLKKLLGPLPPWPHAPIPLCINTQSSYTREKHISQNINHWERGLDSKPVKAL